VRCASSQGELRREEDIVKMGIYIHINLERKERKIDTMEEKKESEEREEGVRNEEILCFRKYTYSKWKDTNNKQK